MRRWKDGNRGSANDQSRPAEQLLQALVALVHRVKESHRVGGVNEDRQAEFAGHCPDRGEPLVVGKHEFIAVIAHVQAQVFPHLHPGRARSCGGA